MSSLPSDPAPEQAPGLVCCPVCDEPSFEPVLNLADLPVDLNSQVAPDRAGTVTRGPVELVVCTRCTHLYNRAFRSDLIEYGTAYENTLHYSGEFQVFANSLADRLVADYGLVGSDVVEVGCGPGHLLSMLCERGVASGLGFDPSYDPDRLGAPRHPAVRISRQVLGPDTGITATFALSQHVLEHLEAPVQLLSTFRQVVGDQGAVYSEVPNAELMIDRTALWDILYEHVSYFTPVSLTAALTRAGLRPTRVDAAFGEQFLWADAVAGGDGGIVLPAPAEADRWRERAVAFGREAQARIAEAGAELDRWLDRGPVALWGAGTKGMTYLNTVAGAGAVSAVIDINPRKHGFGVPGTGLTISGPDSLPSIGPATVLIANPMYANEIRGQLASVGVTADVVPLWS